MKGDRGHLRPRAQENGARKASEEWLTFGDHVFDAFNEVLVDGKLHRHKVRLNENTITQTNNWIKTHPNNDPPWKSPVHENQQYWADRWADQMNYPYWKDRCKAESTAEGVSARKLFYEGTKAYKSADYPLAVKEFKEGLQVWAELLKRHQPYRNDDLNRKDTGLVVKRYARACQQSQVELSFETPFIDLLKAFENDKYEGPLRTPWNVLDNATLNSGPAPIALDPTNLRGSIQRFSRSRGGRQRPPRFASACLAIPLGPPG